MSAQHFIVTRIAHGTVIRGCCGLPDEDPAGGPTCNCKPNECDCTPVKENDNG